MQIKYNFPRNVFSLFCYFLIILIRMDLTRNISGIAELITSKAHVQQQQNVFDLYIKKRYYYFGIFTDIFGSTLSSMKNQSFA